MKINYFFGSDSRSIPAYETLVRSNTVLNNFNADDIRVVTLNNATKVRGKVVQNEFETYCIKNSIKYKYYDSKSVYGDMQNGLVCSFGKIFSKEFIENNQIKLNNESEGKLLLNLHLSLLPDLKGPTPVEYALLYSYTESGVTLFCINNEVDSGNIFWSEKFTIGSDDYATDLYKKSFEIFDSFMLNKELFNKTFIDNTYTISESINKNKKTYKIDKCDLLLNNLNINNAKSRIKALNFIGPALYEYDNDLTLKIHSYVEDDTGIEMKLSDGILYADIITPPGKKMMKANDWLRGRQ